MKQLERLACLRNAAQSVWRARNHLGHAPLPVVERIAIAYLMAPVFVWLLGWFEWWFAIPACAALGVCLLPVLTGSWRVRCRPSAFALALIALAWTMVTASGGVFDGNIPEWVDHRSLLLDLGRQPWPPYVRDDLADQLGGRDEPLLRLNDFDMYFGQRRLMLVREQCPQGLEADPVLVAFLPRDVDTNARTKWSFPLRRVGSGCGVQVGLPGYAVESICVGQIERWGMRLRAVSPWEAKLAIDSAGEVRSAELAPGCHAWHDMAFQDAEMLRRVYDRVIKRVPLSRSRFDVYRDNSAGVDQLVLVRESCGVQDTLARFFLHVSPLNTTSLPSHRRELTFDTLDFVFGERGVMMDGRCVLLIRLPDYAISRVSVGQFDSGGEHWRAAVDW